MKKLWMIKAIILLVYCIPFAFLAVNGDVNSGTMLFYGLMILCFTLLFWMAFNARNIPIVFIGNMLSLVSSCLFAKLTGLAPLGEYFKPFTSYNMIVIVSVASIVIHAIIIFIYFAKHKIRDGK